MTRLVHAWRRAGLRAAARCARRDRAARDHVLPLVRAAEPEPQDGGDLLAQHQRLRRRLVRGGRHLPRGRRGRRDALRARRGPLLPSPRRRRHRRGGRGHVGDPADLLPRLQPARGRRLPRGIEWGFFLAFVASGALAFAGLRMRAGSRPGPPLQRPRSRRERPGARARAAASARVAASASHSPSARASSSPSRWRAARAPPPPRARERPRYPAPPSDAPPTPGSRPNAPYPPSPPEQLSFEDPPPRAD